MREWEGEGEVMIHGDEGWEDGVERGEGDVRAGYYKHPALIFHQDGFHRFWGRSEGELPEHPVCGHGTCEADCVQTTSQAHHV